MVLAHIKCVADFMCEGVFICFDVIECGRNIF